MIVLQETIDDFLVHCRVEKNLSTHTLKAYNLDLKQFTNYLEGKKISAYIELIDKNLIRNYLQKLTETHKAKTVKRKIATLKALFNFLEFEDRIMVNPFRKMRLKIKEPLQLPEVLSIQEIKQLFNVAYVEKYEYVDKTMYLYKSTVRDILVMELLFATGVRVFELCNLKTENVHAERKYIQVNGKGSRERIIQICNHEIMEVLNEYMELFHPAESSNQYFFINRLGKRLSEQSVRFMLKKYTRLSGLDKPVTPHMFRHSFATLLLEENVDIRYIQQLLGHSTITTTQIYTHIAQNKQKEILTSSHPREKFESSPG